MQIGVVLVSGLEWAGALFRWLFIKRDSVVAGFLHGHLQDIFVCFPPRGRCRNRTLGQSRISYRWCVLNSRVLGQLTGSV